MKASFRTLFVLALVLGFVAAATAEDKVTELKGTICCGKCELKETKDCANCIKVKEDGKDVIYYFDDEGKKEAYHKTICTEAKKGSVKGTVTEKDKKKYIKPVKDGVKFEKE